MLKQIHIYMGPFNVTTQLIWIPEVVSSRGVLGSWWSLSATPAGWNHHQKVHIVSVYQRQEALDLDTVCEAHSGVFWWEARRTLWPKGWRLGAAGFVLILSDCLIRYCAGIHVLLLAKWREARVSTERAVLHEWFYIRWVCGIQELFFFSLF